MTATEQGSIAAFVEAVGAAALFDVIPSALIAVEPSGTVLWANRRVEDVFGWPPDELVGREVEELIPEELRGDHRVVRGGYVAGGTERPMSSERRFEALRRDGSTFAAQISLSRLPTRDGTVVLAAVNDMSEWIDTEHRAFVAQRRTIVAEDRDRIARNLHDTVVQELFGLGMSVQSWVTSVPDDELRPHLAEAVRSIDRIIREIRATIFGLPTWADASTGDVTDAIEDIVRSIEPHLGFRPEVEVVDTGAEQISDAVVEHLLPSVREALTNIARHAHASRAHLRLEIGEEIRLTVTDDGVGLPPSIDHTGGLDNLARRAAVLGGRMTVEAGREGGTVLHWEVPARPPDDDDDDVVDEDQDPDEDEDGP